MTIKITIPAEEIVACIARDLYRRGIMPTVGISAYRTLLTIDDRDQVEFTVEYDQLPDKETSI
jgi:hypothetical protein